jgi:prephenate dehydrogenase
MNVVIIGLGIIGGSYAKGLSKAGYSVYGVDKDLSTIEYAKKEGYIIDGSLNAKDFLPLTDLVVIGLYPDDVITFIENNLQYFKEGQVVTDVCGVKESICKKATDLLKNCYFIGSHPMAGREKIGIKYADEKIFAGTNFLMCPIESTNQVAINVVAQMARDLGFGHIHQISPKFHDEMIAYTSQLTHAIAVSLVNSNSNDEVVKFIGDSYRDLTRIAMINETLWSQLFIENKESLINQIDNFIQELEIVKSAIDSENLDLLKDKFISSKKKREVM